MSELRRCYLITWHMKSGMTFLEAWRHKGGRGMRGFVRKLEAYQREGVAGFERESSR